MNLEECYEAIDSDYDDVMRRLGSETLVRKFVLKFLDDTSFRGLKEGLEKSGCRTRIPKCTYIERRVHESWIYKVIRGQLSINRRASRQRNQRKHYRDV